MENIKCRQINPWNNKFKKIWQFLKVLKIADSFVKTKA